MFFFLFLGELCDNGFENRQSNCWFSPNGGDLKLLIDTSSPLQGSYPLKI